MDMIDGTEILHFAKIAMQCISLGALFIIALIYIQMFCEYIMK